MTTITIERKLLEQALGALTYQGTMGPTRRQRRTAAIKALHAELAKPQGEPVAIVVDPYDTPGLQWLCQHPPTRGTRLYTHPAQPDEFDAVAIRYAHKLALDLECVLSGNPDRWFDTAMQTIGEYRSAMNAIHERESPTFMGEPVIRKDKP